MNKNLISCSILNVDLFSLKQTLDELSENEIPYLHFDVMDGVFVNNLSFGASLLKNIKNKDYKFFYDVHLMIIDSKKYYLDFIKAGADSITFHIESYNDDFEKVMELINLIKKENVKVGLSIRPATNVEDVFKYLPYIDLVLIMSVEPGFGGQEFIENTYDKVKKLKEEIVKNNYPTLISVDGGINECNSYKLRSEGVDILVSGTYLIKDIKGRKKILE